MILVEGKTYICENRVIVTVKRNSLPYYSFSATEDHISEVWTKNGQAYHSDCDWNIIEEFNPEK